MFTLIARFILRNRILSLLILYGATAFMLYQGQFVNISYQFSRLLPTTDSTQIKYEMFQDRYKQVGNTVVIAAEDLNIFEKEGYKTWKKLQEDLQNILGIVSALSSINAYDLTLDDSTGQLKPFPLIKDYTNPDLVAFENRFHELKVYDNMLFSKNRAVPLMIVTVDEQLLYKKEIKEIVESIKDVILSTEKDTGKKIHVSGLPYIRMANVDKISKEIGLFIGLSLLVTCIILYIFLRSFRAMLISVVVVSTAVIWTFGLISSLGHTISMLSALIPTLMIIIGVPNCIFLINKYHAEYKHHGNKILALQRVIRKIGAATLMTNTTTALGFAALILTHSTVLKEFGMVASINILLIFVISIVVIPVAYSFLAPPKKRHYTHFEKRWITSFVSYLTFIVKEKRPLVYVVTLICLALGIFGATQIYTTGSLTEDYSKSDDLYKDLKFFEEAYGGIVPLEFEVNTKRKNGVLKGSTLKKLDAMQQELDAMPELSRSLSVVNGIKFAKQGYYRGDSSFYSLPNSQERSFILSAIPKGNDKAFQMATSMYDSSGQYARISMQAKDLGTEEAKVLHDRIKTKADSIFEQDRYDYILTGASVIFLKGTDYLIKNLLLSLLLAVFVISIIMSVLFRSFTMVLVSLLPNLFPLILTAGLMGFFGIPLKPSTILVFSIAFGISVDDTIHFLAKYRQELLLSNKNIGRSVLLAIKETGVSMLYTSIVLFFGFGVLIASDFGGTQALGMLISITLIMAMFSNLVLLPSLLLSFEKRLLRKAFTEPYITIYDEVEDDEEDETKILNQKV